MFIARAKEPYVTGDGGPRSNNKDSMENGDGHHHQQLQGQQHQLGLRSVQLSALTQARIISFIKSLFQGVGIAGVPGHDVPRFSIRQPINWS